MATEGYSGLQGRLVEKLGERGGLALYSFFACAIVLLPAGIAADVLAQPLIFPSLGPTAYLFFENPLAPRASPRNTLVGHLVAVLAGAFSLAVFGLLDHPSILTEGVTHARVGAAVLSVSLTGALLLLIRASHPPAGATVLIVSLGLLQAPLEMVDLMVGVVVITVLGYVVNRAAGVPVPIWSAQDRTLPEKG